MMIKFFRQTGLVLLSIVLLMSCSDFLEENTESVQLQNEYYKTAEQAEIAVVGAYGALQREGVYGQMQYHLTTDIIRAAVWNEMGGIGTYSFSSENTDVILPIWRDHYLGINEINAAVNRIPNIDMDADRKNTLLAESRFLRALFYFNLVRYFGDVPYIDKEVVSLDNLNVSRSPAALVYEKVIEDLEFANQFLDSKTNAQIGRATVEAGKTLLAKVYLTKASLAKRDGTGDNGIADFGRAADLANEVIATGVHRLEPYFPDAFTIENKNNREIIFDVQYKKGSVGEGGLIGVRMGMMGNINLGGSFGNIHSTEYYSTIFEDTDIVRKEWSTPHVRIDNEGDLLYFADSHWQPWSMAKFRNYPLRSTFVLGDRDMNWPVFRYAELLLIYAEATNEVNNGPNSDVFNALNQLRARARNVNGDGTIEFLNEDILPRELTTDASILPDISLSDYPDYESMREYIMFERARELGGEGKRWFDLVRWGNLVERIQFLGVFLADGRNTVERNFDIAVANVAERHLLLPVPSVEIQANPNLLPNNPGY